MAKKRGKTPVLSTTPDAKGKYRDAYEADLASDEKKKAESRYHDFRTSLMNSKKSYNEYYAKIEENLKAARKGLASSRDHATAERIIEALDEVIELQEKKLHRAEAYIAEIGTANSDRLDGFDNEDEKSEARYIVDKYQLYLVNQHEVFANKRNVLDAQLKNIDSALTPKEGEAELTPKRIQELKEQKSELIEQKQKMQEDYMGLVGKIIGDREAELHRVDFEDKMYVNGVEKPGGKQSSRSRQASATEKAKMAISGAFDNGEKAARPGWEKLKSIPLIGGILVKSGSSIKTKFKHAFGDLGAGYAAMKNRRYERHEERALQKTFSKRDKRLGLEDGTSYREYLDSSEHTSKENKQAETLESEDASVDETTVANTNPFVRVPNDERVSSTEPSDSEPSESSTDVSEDLPKELSREERYANQLRLARNKAVVEELDKSELGNVLQTFFSTKFWRKTEDVVNIVEELKQSDDVQRDLLVYVKDLKSIAGTFSDEYKNPLVKKIDAEMTKIMPAVNKRVDKVKEAQALFDELDGVSASVDEKNDEAEGPTA